MERLNALIVEDDRDTAHFFQMVMSLLGFNCELAFSAKEALSELALNEPDLILLDMRLGQELDGGDILFQIRSNPRLDNTRVIVITAYPGMADQIDNLADLILLKPVEVDQLRNLVERMVSLETAPATTDYFRDPVTDLFNETFFKNRLGHAIERVKRRSDFIFATMYFTVEQIREEGEDTQPDVKNEILRQVADRLRGNIRPTDTISRLSGGKFATLHEELKQRKDIKIIIQRVKGKLLEPYMVNDKPYKVNLTIGAVVCDKSCKQVEGVIEQTEDALDKALKATEDGIYIIGLKRISTTL
jgi:diguanylate cyclase (GGDEF)-like protein